MTHDSKHEGCRRQFVQLSRAWYADVCLPMKDAVDEVNVGFFAPDGSTTGEFCVKWIDLGSHGLAPRLEVFNDAWDALWQFRDVLEKMAGVDGQDISPEEFCELLKSCGVKDATPVEDPREAVT